MARHTWSRWPKEPAAAWTAFLCFRDMDHPRSVLGAYRDWLEEKGRDKRDPASVPGAWSGWVQTYDWHRRVREYDDYLDQRKLTEREQQLSEMERRHASLARLAQGKVLESLQSMKPEDITANSLAQILQAAVRIEREAMGRAGDTINVNHQMRGMVGVVELNEIMDMSPEELDEHIDKLRTYEDRLGIIEEATGGLFSDEDGEAEGTSPGGSEEV